MTDCFEMLDAIDNKIIEIDICIGKARTISNDVVQDFFWEYNDLPKTIEIKSYQALNDIPMFGIKAEIIHDYIRYTERLTAEISAIIKAKTTMVQVNE